MSSKKKTGSVPVVVFTVLAVLWGAEVLFFYETLDSATEERDRLVALEEEKAAERELLERRVQELQHYTDIMLKDTDFIEKEAREITGGAVNGEIIIRPEES